MASVHAYTTGAGKRWKVAYRDVDGKQRTKGGFKRKGEATDYADGIDRLARSGGLGMLQKGTTTFGEYVSTRWVPNNVAHLEAKTRAGYAHLIGRWLEDTFADVPLQRITPDRIRDWQAAQLATLPKSGRGTYAIKRAQKLLRQILQRAAEDGYIDRNPADVVRHPKVPKAMARRGISIAQIERLRRGARTERDRALISTLAYAGLRPGELQALRWRDIGEQTILVEKSADDDGRIKGTKTDAHRTVKLLDYLAADLKAWREAAGRPGPMELVFPAAGGAPFTSVDWGNWRSRSWTAAWQAAAAQAARDAGAEPGTPEALKAAEAALVAPANRVTPYELRHSFASMLLASGMQAHSVAKQLGHKPEMTVKTYGHVIDEYEGRRQPLNVDEEIAKARAA